MSIESARPYFRTILDGLGYEEHRDFLNFDNIPHTTIDRKYHIESLSLSAGGAEHQTVYTFLYDINVRLFRIAYNDTVTTFEELETDVAALLEECLRASNRLSTTNGLLDVLPGSITFDSIDSTNDNLQVAVIGFTVSIKECF